MAPRNEIRPLTRWAASLGGPRQESVLVGCYICPKCPEGERWFRLQPPGFEGWRNYTTSSILTVLSLVTRFKMPFDGAARLGRELLHLPGLHETTVLRWYREAGDKVDYRSHLQRMAEVFSGQLALDEVYDADHYVIKATDPINNLEISSWIGDGSPTAEDIRACLLELREAGFNPLLVVTDGSSLYPRVIREVWPDAEHQLCVFHFIRGAFRKLGRVFWAAYNTMPKPKKRKRGRPPKRGRPRLDQRKRADRKKVSSVRHLIFKRGGMDANDKPLLSDGEQRALDEALRLCPALVERRRFVEALLELFGPTTTSHDLANERRLTILDDEVFADLPGLEPTLEDLRNDELFARLTRYLAFENADKTSNHVERENRELRRRQRSHYRLRSIQSLCAFIELLLVRRPVPEKPQRLRRRERRTVDNPSHEEANAA